MKLILHLNCKVNFKQKNFPNDQKGLYRHFPEIYEQPVKTIERKGVDSTKSKKIGLLGTCLHTLKKIFEIDNGQH